MPSLASCISQSRPAKPLASIMSILLQQPVLIGSLRLNCGLASRWPPPKSFLQSIVQKQSAGSQAYHNSPSQPPRSARGFFSHHVPIAPLIYSSPRPASSYLETRYHRTFFSSGRSPYEASSFFIKAIIAFCSLSFVLKGYAGFLRDKRNDPTLSAKYDENCVCSSRNYREGRWWVLFTSSVTHSSLLHLGLNMYALYSVAPTTIVLCGIPGFIALWGITALSCAGAHIYWEEINTRSATKRWNTTGAAEKPPSFLGITPNSSTREAMSGSAGAVGASGVLFGMTTVLACMRPNIPVQIMFIPIGFPIWAFMAASAGFSWWALATGAVRGLGHAGHLGGMAGGFGFWLFRTVVRRGR